MLVNDDIPKYKKRKKKKTKNKSNHKHIYSKEVLFKRETKCGERYYYGTICEICGKVGEEKYFETRECVNGRFCIMLTQEEILEKYKGLPVVRRNKYD